MLNVFIHQYNHLSDCDVNDRKGLTVDAWLAIADLIGRKYFKEHFESSCQSYSADIDKNIDYEYFIGFEENDNTEICIVFTKVSVNLKTIGKID